MPNSPDLHSLLNRPPTERLREHKYRFAQCLIFGLPVFGLHFLGPKLGGPNSPHWTGLLQSLLAGWCIYLAAIPLLIEGLLLLANRKPKPDLLIATLALLFYLLGLIGWIQTLTARTALFPPAFPCSVLLLIIWSGLQWLRFARSSTSDQSR